MRALSKCNANTVVITNLSPMPPFTVAIGRGVYPDIEKMKELIQPKVSRLIAFNAQALAEEAGNVLAVNMVLLGALIQTGIIPVTTDQVHAAMKTRTKSTFLESNQKAFELGFEAAGQTGINK